jgi:hypothetical protein
MTDQTDTRWDPGEAQPRRRRVLGALGVATAGGLAGCLGALGGSDGDDEDEADDTETATPTATPTEDQMAACSQIADGGYQRYDEPDSAFVATFEYPGDVALRSCVNGRKGLTIRTTIGDRQPFDLIVVQNLAGEQSQTDPMTGDVDGLQQVGDLQFGGETVPLVRSSGGSNADPGAEYQVEYPYYVVGLPHGGAYYRFDVRATVAAADDLEPTDCGATWADVSERVVRSLEPNADTTIASTDEC